MQRPKSKKPGQQYIKKELLERGWTVEMIEAHLTRRQKGGKFYYRAKEVIEQETNPDIAAELILCALVVVQHPALYGLPCVVRAPPAYAPAAVIVHAAHHDRLQNLDERVVNVLVGPLDRLADYAPLPGTRVPALGYVRRLLLEAVKENLSQILYAFGLGLLHPSCASVRAVVRFPMVGTVYLVNRKAEVFI